MSPDEMVKELARHYDLRPGQIHVHAVTFALSAGQNFLDYIAESAGRSLDDPAADALVQAMFSAVNPDTTPDPTSN